MVYFTRVKDTQAVGQLPTHTLVKLLSFHLCVPTLTQVKQCFILGVLPPCDGTGIHYIMYYIIYLYIVLYYISIYCVIVQEQSQAFRFEIRKTTTSQSQPNKNQTENSAFLRERVISYRTLDTPTILQYLSDCSQMPLSVC